jgi:AraC-like DNA-binding protein
MHMAKPVLLWVDCVSGIADPEHRIRSAQSFEVVQSEGTRRIDDEITRHKPAALCFEFDYPDRERLLAMQSVKRSHPRIPILMLTLGHSESLAVWAFRARVWNYLVKPVPGIELSETLRTLASICHRTSPPRAAQHLAMGTPDGVEDRPISADVARLQPGLDYVTAHYHERVSADAAAKSCGLTRFEFSRRFRAAFGMTFRDYLMKARINEARRLLVAGDISVTGVAYSVGFNDGSHFARMFRRVTGVHPSAYRDSDLARLHERRRRSTDQVEPLAASV